MTPNRYEGLRRAELRRIAQGWQIHWAETLTKADLIAWIRKAEQLAALTRAELDSAARRWQLATTDSPDAQTLVRLLLQVERWKALPVAALRTEARRRGLAAAARLKKDDLIRTLAKSDIETARREAAGVTRAGEILQRLRRLPWRSWLGFGLRIMGASGALASATLMVLTPILATKVIPSTRQALGSVSTTLQSTAQTLELVAQSMERAAEVLDSASGSLRIVEGSLSDTRPLLESVGQLVGDQAPMTVENARVALSSAVEGARAIDQVLYALDRLGPLTGIRYDPEQPLERSLSEAAAGLAPLPEALREIRTDLNLATSELDEMRSGLATASRELDLFSITLARLERDLRGKAVDLEAQATVLERAEGAVVTWVVTVAVAVELALLWAGATQWAVWYVGREIQRSYGEA